MMMSEAQIITILLSLVATFFGLLVVIISWLGNKVYEKLSEMATTMHGIEIDLHGKISSLDRRMTVVETILSGDNKCST